MKYEKPMIINLGKADDLIAGNYAGGQETISDVCLDEASGKWVTHSYTNPNGKMK